jgi:NAD(P)-dependent dehydrogenase (short-subunit alcohol dehydrogenase family)
MSARPLEGRHAVVTGGGAGIGAATASKLSDLGARLTLIGRDAKKLDAVASSLADAVAAPADVANESQIEGALEAGRKRFGPVTLLVNNAGIAPSQPFLKTTRQTLEQVMETNLTGAFLMSQAALPDMLAESWGRIVNVASTSALRGYAYVSAYCASKHALLGLTRALALEVARKGVTVNAVCPSFVETDIVERAVENIVAKTGRSAGDARAELAAGNPMGRLLKPEEVASAIAWLCLPESGGVNGAALPITGGEL